MLKLTLNRVRVDLRLEPVTPMLIKTGDKGAALLHPERPALMFVRTGRRDRETVYVPGASTKGVVRSAAERVLRSVERHCCDPLNPKEACHRAASQKGDDTARRGSPDPHPQAPVYAMLCYACRTFGSQAIASRVAFADAYPSPEHRDRMNATEVRNGVSIDRKTGGPAGQRLFDMEVVTGGAFLAMVHMTNIQLWQLALIGIVLRDMEEGFVRFGSAKSRGFGHVRLVPNELTFEQAEQGCEAPGPLGVAALHEDLVTPYDLLPSVHDRLGSAMNAEATPGSIGRRFRWRGPEAVWNVLESCAELPWRGFLEEARKAAS